MSKSDTELIQRIDKLDKKLETLIKLVAITSNMETLKEKPQKEQIRLLSILGLSRNLIALLVGTTPLSVSVTLSQMKKGKKHKGKGTSLGKKGKK